MGVYVLGVLVYCVCVCVCTCILGWVLVPKVYEQSNELFSIGATTLILDAMLTLGAFYTWEGSLVSRMHCHGWLHRLPRRWLTESF